MSKTKFKSHYLSLITLVSLLAACGAEQSVDVNIVVDDAKEGAARDNERNHLLDMVNGYHPEVWPKRKLSPPRVDAIEQRAADILTKMSIAEKVGQIMQPELKYMTPEDVKTYHIGSVLNGGGTTPNNDKFATAQDWANLAEQYYQASMDDSDGKAAIPIIWGSDAVHGNNNVFGSTLFPHNIGLGAANDPELIRRIGEVTAIEVAVTGVDWTFGPTVAVARDVRWGRTFESYSEDPRIVMDYAKQMVLGIQGEESRPGVFKPQNLVATAKHFIGDGGTTLGVDRGDTLASEQALAKIHAAGYISALDGNVLTTMASFNSWNGDKLHGHKYLLTDILKTRMGFDGLIVSDWNGHMQVPGCTVEQCAAAINAGLDLVMVVSDWKAMIKNTIESVESGEIPMSRLDDAVTRVLRVKLRAGLFDAGPILKRLHVGDQALLGHADHRAVAREAVRKSLVLLKNNGGVLPISPKANVLVVGDGANNIGKQAGGWTLSWQGTGNSNDDFPGATSIFSGIHDAMASAGGQAVLSEDGSWGNTTFSNGKKPDVVVMVYGEEPYAEWHGDLSSIEYQYGDNADLTLLRTLQQQSLPIVSVFISGRPLWVNREINASDAFVAAWLPGSEGGGVADVLIASGDGLPRNDFTGRLSFSWPKSVSQAVLNVGDDGYDPLFPYGYGLRYSDRVDLENNLDESTQPTSGGALEELWLFVSREMSNYQFSIQDLGAESVIVNRNRQVSSVDENLLLMSVDKVAQEDARRMTWKGLRSAKVSFNTVKALNLNPYLAANSVLELQFKVDVAPQTSVSLAMECDDCAKPIDLTGWLVKAPLGKFQKLQIDLSCFASKEGRLENVSSVFTVNSNSEMDVVMADMKIVPAQSSEQSGACSVQ